MSTASERHAVEVGIPELADRTVSILKEYEPRQLSSTQINGALRLARQHPEQLNGFLKKQRDRASKRGATDESKLWEVLEKTATKTDGSNSLRSLAEDIVSEESPSLERREYKKAVDRKRLALTGPFFEHLAVLLLSKERR